MRDDFYIGYLPKMPKGLAGGIRIFLGVVFLASLSSIILFWIGQKPFPASFFEFDTLKDYEGSIQAGPVPFLLIEKGKTNGGLPAFDRYPLVAEGKHGIGESIKEFDGRSVRLKGKLIYRDDLKMIEVAADSIEAASQSANPISEVYESLGMQKLRGEIVDSKCYLGVMNPGHTKPHRECAVRCISGGIPPLFLVKDIQGNTSELWLLSSDGKAINKEILDFIAEPIEIEGEVKRSGDQLYFYIDAGKIKRLQ